VTPETSVEITSGKQPLRIANRLIGASGAFGFAGEYSKLVDLTTLGAIVTNPVTLKPRRAASGTRVVSLDSGVLVHTGLPNPGVHKVYQLYGSRWKNSRVPIIVHVAAISPEEVGKCAQVLALHESIVAFEIGLSDDATTQDVRQILKAARENTFLPLLARLPLYHATHVALAAAGSGADALIVAAPPRGTARDPMSGQLIGGRVYGPWLKALALRAVGQIAGRVPIPIIGCGGIHTPADARDYLEAGAVAVQVDSLVWVRPEMVERIARNLGGLELTRVAGSLPDEWGPQEQTTAMPSPLLPSPPPVAPPSDLPE